MVGIPPIKMVMTRGWFIIAIATLGEIMNFDGTRPITFNHYKHIRNDGGFLIGEIIPFEVRLRWNHR